MILRPAIKTFVRSNHIKCFSAMKRDNELHKPVMVKEMVKMFDLKPGATILDMTFGAGGHSKALLKEMPDIKIFALDRDPTSYKLACELQKHHENQIFPMLGKFSELPVLLKQIPNERKIFDGVLFDFGCSSMQFDRAERGFSVSKDGPLDMRMDGNRIPDLPTAADVIAQASELDLVKIFKIYGEEKLAKKIARALIEARYLFTKLETTKQLCELVEAVLEPKSDRFDKLKRPAHSATKIFQALRIFVNNELNEINYGLILAHRYLKIGGICVAITFHSLEDTIVKRHMLGNTINNVINPLPLKYSNCMSVFNKNLVDPFFDHDWQMLHKHVIVPEQNEIESNPRSRSAKLRAAIKIK